MATIYPTDILIARLQSQLGVSTSSLSKRKEAAPANRKEEQRRANSKPADTQESQLASRISAIDKSDPDRRRKIFKAFLESALLAELGQDVINDPAFYRLIEDVYGAMSNDAQIKQSIEAAVDTLEKMT
jgi:hypothetical protein